MSPWVVGSIHFALSVLGCSGRTYTWAVGPGSCISRRWRFDRTYPTSLNPAANQLYLCNLWITCPTCPKRLC